MLSESSSLNDIPALAPPPHVTSNFTNPPTIMAWIIGVAVTTMVLMLAAIVIRLFTRLVLLKEWWLEDYLAVLAVIAVVTWEILFVYTASLGMSRHQWDIRMVDMPRLLELTNILETLYGPTMFAAKYSVLLQLKRIFCGARQRDSVWWILTILMAAVTIYYWACFISFVFQCWPRAKIQNPLIEGVCIDISSATLAAGVINLVTDVGMLVAPLFAIWRLQMPVKRKLGVASVFGVGLLACITGVFGVVWRMPLLTSSDLTWILSKTGLWAMAEFCAIILVGCMPSIPMFAKRVVRGSDKNASRYNPSGNDRYTFSSKRNKIADALTGPGSSTAYLTIHDGSSGVKGSEGIRLEIFDGRRTEGV
ncbi:hypothetical protein K458DRAFT_395333 [Lentithecium fluviatile CBS 122367]|uniref:Rhodopsin domain-containing protein n=1 Tax=Lentithecium fluviatile CBS 122367 TaxID=1168545 RepID=A0A6G1IIS3_9PLEO|nr:hypothetical protein K458DRAFT_395333 [Lentithecium fluviatile CBS 122367]